jgi:ribonuclease D
MIDTQEELDALTDQLEKQDVLAIDCEMDSMYAYGTSLCVVQIGWEDKEALLDGLVELDRSRLGALFADARKVKIFHGGENDIGLMRSHWGFDFSNTFDTMAASQILGHKGVGLAAALERHFEVQISKKYQKADWRIRPLPKDQADYARIDVRYLIALRECLLDELEELGRVEEAESEFARIARANITDKPFDPDNWVRVKGGKQLPDEARGLLREIYVARDSISKRLDRAPYRVFHDSAIVELAKRRPETESQCKDVRGVSRNLSPKDVQLLLDAVQRGVELGEIPLPAHKGRRKIWEHKEDSKLTAEQEALFESLRKWRVKRAADRGVDVARIATTSLLMLIAGAQPKTPRELAAVKGMEPWRQREYGDELLAVVCEKKTS